MAAQSIFGTNFTFPLEMSQCVKRFDTKAVCRTSDARRPTSIARLLIVNMPLPQQTLACGNVSLSFSTCHPKGLIASLCFDMIWLDMEA